MDIKRIVKENKLEILFKEATIGLEREGQRVLADSSIAKSIHPKEFGIRQTHPYIKTDFAESQLEFITMPKNTEKDVVEELNVIHEISLKTMSKDEYIWPLSIPAILPDEEDIMIAKFEDENDIKYREYLSEVYGKYKQMVSGIHYNFGLSEKFIEKVALLENKSNIETRNNIFMKLSRQFIRYQWLLIYLFGASPIAEEKYFSKGEMIDRPVRSLRTSRYGYVNSEEIKVSYSTLEDYIKDITNYVKNGQLSEEREFYSTVRFRGAKTVADFMNKGIQYMEFRLFDLNPYAELGIKDTDVRFVHLFLLLMLWLEEENKEESVRLGQEYSEQVSLEHPTSKTKFEEEGNKLLQSMLAMLDELGCKEEDYILVNNKIKQIKNPELTVGGVLWKEYEKIGSMAELGMKYAVQYKNNFLKKMYSLRVFSDMELSTQALIYDAMRLGVKVEVLDRRDQFLRLEYEGKIEYVKNGNMTSKDSYISPLIMENKVVTKKVLSESGFRVPSSYQCTTLEEALDIYSIVKNNSIVIKPKSTNYGLGITIFKKSLFSEEDYKLAVEIALKEDKEIMIEEYIEGTEYRFFVIDGVTKAVLLRVPANVVGDGINSIKTLVSEKNKDSLRGDASTTPLKKIVLGDIEKLHLKEQGYTEDTILNKDQTAYLRANSNISTGGDSIDMTDAMHPSYKEIAGKVSDAMFAKVCGVDLIIPNYKKSAYDDENSYGIIEANFNPMMMMHIFPYSGKSRRLTVDILSMLFPTLKI